VRRPCTTWRLAAKWNPPSDIHETLGLGEAWRLAVGRFYQAVCTGFAWWHLGFARR